MVSTLINPKFKFETRRTAGGGAVSVVSSFEGVGTWLSVTGSDSDGAGVGSEDVASVVSTALTSLGTSASYRTSVLGIDRIKERNVGTYDSFVDGLLQVLLGDYDTIVVADRGLGGAWLRDGLKY